MRLRTLGPGSAALMALALPVAASADSLVTTGSPATTFPQNKQNEPGLAVDQFGPTMLVAGANEEVDLGACGTGWHRTAPSLPA